MNLYRAIGIAGGCRFDERVIARDKDEAVEKSTSGNLWLGKVAIERVSFMRQAHVMTVVASTDPLLHPAGSIAHF